MKIILKAEKFVPFCIISESLNNATKDSEEYLKEYFPARMKTF